MPGNDSGATPITVKSVPFRRIVRPMTAGSLANSCFQKSGPSTTTTSRPGTRSSSSRKPRPSCGVHVVTEVRQPANASGIAYFLFPLLQPLHGAHGRVARVFLGKPLLEAFRDLVFQVELELLVKLLLHPAAAQHGPQPQRQRE